MPDVYSTYDAKARFSEILRKVRAGESVLITYRGREVAEIKPVDRRDEMSLEERLEELEREGIITGAAKRLGTLEPIADRPGALQRFLEDRNR